MESRQNRLSEFLIPLVFLILGAVGVLTHEFWRDEAGPWLVIQSSHSIRELIANLGYTGHTHSFFVWQYTLYKFFHTPIAGSVANLLLMTAAIWMVVRTSPFSNLQKWLFALGFYPLYQYAVFNRMYAFLVFFQFAYCALYVAKPQRTLLRWLMLIAMTETHMIGMLAAIPLAMLDIIRHWRHEMSSRLEKLFCGFKFLFFIFAISSVLLQLWPADESYHSLNPASPLLAFLGFSDGFLPNYGILFESYYQMIIGMLLWIAATMALWRHPKAFTTYLTLILPLALFSAIIYTGHRWHHGFYWIYWVMALWMTGVGILTDRRLALLTTLLFSLHAAMGLYALIDDGLHPYSGGQDIAHHIRDNGLVDLPMVGAEVFRDSHKGIVYKWEIDQLQPVMLALTGARVYDPRAGETISFWNHYDSKLYFPRRSLYEFEWDLQALTAKLGSAFLVIVATEPGLPAPELPPNLKLIYRAERARDFGEHLSLYQFSDSRLMP